jgi:hypothetical protein
LLKREFFTLVYPSLREEKWAEGRVNLWWNIFWRNGHHIYWFLSKDQFGGGYFLQIEACGHLLILKVLTNEKKWWAGNVIIRWVFLYAILAEIFKQIGAGPIL